MMDGVLSSLVNGPNILVFCAIFFFWYGKPVHCTDISSAIIFVFMAVIIAILPLRSGHYYKVSPSQGLLPALKLSAWSIFTNFVFQSDLAILEETVCKNIFVVNIIDKVQSGAKLQNQRAIHFKLFFIGTVFETVSLETKIKRLWFNWDQLGANSASVQLSQNICSPLDRRPLKSYWILSPHVWFMCVFLSEPLKESTVYADFRRRHSYVTLSNHGTTNVLHASAAPSNGAHLYLWINSENKSTSDLVWMQEMARDVAVVHQQQIFTHAFESYCLWMFKSLFCHVCFEGLEHISYTLVIFNVN